MKIREEMMEGKEKRKKERGCKKRQPRSSGGAEGLYFLTPDEQLQMVGPVTVISRVVVLERVRKWDGEKETECKVLQ